MRRVQLCLIALLLIAANAVGQNVPAPWPNPDDVIRQSLSHWRRNLDAAKNYTFQQRQVEEELEKDGDVKKTEIKTYDISIIYGEPYEKLIAKDDKPLSEKDQQKEEEKLNKFFEKQQKKSDNDREKERAKERDKFQREIADELPRMLTWRLVDEEEVNGHRAWVLTATPRADYHPNSMAGKLLSKMTGKVWITEADYQWVKVEATLADDFAVGWFLFKLHKGMHLEFEQTRVNDEVWLPKRTLLNGSGRIAVKSGRFRSETTFSNYRKFTTEVKVTGVAEQQPEPAAKP